jgi:hypothetical protein
MMKRMLICTMAAGLLTAWSLTARTADDAKDDITGTWECTAHGFEGGDMPFTLTLQLDKEAVTGSVSSVRGDAEISSGTYKNHTLELHISGGEAEYVITGKLEGGKLSGEWSSGDQKGTWEGKKSAAG